MIKLNALILLVLVSLLACGATPYQPIAQVPGPAHQDLPSEGADDFVAIPELT